MNERSIAVCDTDPRYALDLSGALAEWVPSEFEISSFTGAETLAEYSRDHHIDIIIISQSAYDSTVLDNLPANLMILRETPDFAPERAILIDRFQAKEELLKSVIKQLPDTMETCLGKRMATKSWKVIGVYSPVRRCLQTTFSLSLGQMLAQDHKVLYMNFENYSGFSSWLGSESRSNVVDLLYYFDCDPDRLSVRIPLMVHHLGNLDILPPANGYYDTYDRNGEKWVEIIKAIENATEYEYLILDLTDAMCGLLEVMEYCNRIYTCVRSDAISKAKLAEYERWMVDHSRADVMSKSVRFSFPEFTDLPEDPQMLTHCELAGYVRSIINEDTLE